MSQHNFTSDNMSHCFNGIQNHISRVGLLGIAMSLFKKLFTTKTKNQIFLKSLELSFDKLF